MTSEELERTGVLKAILDKDIENNTVSVRSRKDGDIGAMSIDEFIEKITDDVNTKRIW